MTGYLYIILWIWTHYTCTLSPVLGMLSMIAGGPCFLTNVIHILKNVWNDRMTGKFGHIKMQKNIYVVQHNADLVDGS